VRGNLFFKKGEKGETGNTVREIDLSRVEALLAADDAKMSISKVRVSARQQKKESKKVRVFDYAPSQPNNNSDLISKTFPNDIKDFISRFKEALHDHGKHC